MSPAERTRGDQRYCPECQRWHHHSRFRSFRRQGTLSPIRFKPLCRACEQIIRNRNKNEDRPRAIIERRARDLAQRCGVAFEFVWDRLGWCSLVPQYRAHITDPDACCPSCFEKFDNERDIQIDHIFPPRRLKDWARHSARNLRFLCTNCNRTKGAKDFGQYLDDEESATVANEAVKTATTMQRRWFGPGTLFPDPEEA